MSRRTGWDRWIALLLRAYPRGFRARFGRDLIAQYPAPREHRFSAGMAAARELARGGLGARLDDLRRPREGAGGLDGLRADATHAVRSLTRRPWFAGMVATTLALAAGLNTAVFGILDVTLLRPLPYPNEQSLVSIGLNWKEFTHASVSLAEYVDFRTRATTFESMAVFSSASVNLASAGGVAERVQGARTTASLFETLGVQPQLGRAFTTEEDVADAPVAVISHRFWMRRYGGAADVIGRDLPTDSGVRQIVGVMPDAFGFPADNVDIWLPMNLVPGNPGSRGAHMRQAIGRVAAGVSLPVARQEFDRIARDLAREYPASYPEGSGFGINLIPLRDDLVGSLREPLQVLMAAVLFVLVIACANVANLMVARASERSRETATRVAFGASRLRLVRQSLFEGLLAGVMGGAGGVLLAAWLMNALTPWLPDDLPRPDSVISDARVIAFALAVTAFAGALTAAFTAMRATRVSTTEALKGSRSTAEAARARALLTTAQVALSVMLLVCGGFAARSFMRLLDTNPGLRIEQVATARVSLSSMRYPTDQARAAFFDRVHETLTSRPGVTAAGAISLLPLSGQFSDWSLGIEGWVPPAPGIDANEQARVVHGDYFDVLDIPLISGRLFTPQDNLNAPRVAIVSELLAKKYWKDGNPIGRRLKRWGLDSDEPWTTVVGVVGDVRHLTLNQEPVPFIYFPAAQLPSGTMTLLARVADNVDAGPELIAGAVRAVDIEQPAWSPRTMEQWVSRSVAEPRFNLLLLSIFGGLAVVLAAVGVYGVMAFGVNRRARELGIRAALGAEPRSLMRGVLREGALLATAGISIGGAAGLLVGRSLSAAFYDVRLADPIVLGGVPLFVLAIALVASYLPARRAMRIDPVIALRAD